MEVVIIGFSMLKSKQQNTEEDKTCQKERTCKSAKKKHAEKAKKGERRQKKRNGKGAKLHAAW